MLFKKRKNIVCYKNEEIIIGHKIIRGLDVLDNVKDELNINVYLDKDCICILENEDNQTMCGIFELLQ